MNSAHHLPCHPSTKHTHLLGYTWYLSAVKLSLAVQFVIQWIIMANWNIDWKHPGSNFPNIHTLCHLLWHPSRHQLPSFHDFYRLLTPPIIIVAVYVLEERTPRQCRNWLWIWTRKLPLFVQRPRNSLSLSLLVSGLDQIPLHCNSVSHSSSRIAHSQGKWKIYLMFYDNLKRMWFPALSHIGALAM